MARITSLTLAALTACAHASDRSPEDEALAKRVAEVEARLGRLEAQVSPPPAGLPAVAREAGSAEITLVLDEEATVSCAFTNL